MDIVDRIFLLADKQYAEQKDFAEALGVTPTMVSAWRKRKSSSYSKRVDTIAKTLNTSVDYLWTGEKKEPTALEDGEPMHTITFNRNGKVVKKQYSAEKWEAIIKMLDAIPEDRLP